MTLWTVGNAAKLYCLNYLATYAAQHPEPFTILDLGCGDGRNFIRLMQHFPQVRYVGIEPLQSDCDKARAALPPDRTTIIHGLAYEGIRPQLPQPTYDFVVSFSVLEHVYQRPAYFEFVASCLKPDGQVLMNYDAGHFVNPTWRDRIKTALGPLLARFGDESRYQAFVKDKDVQDWIAQAGLSVIEAKMFNTALKGVYKSIPTDQRDAFMTHWLFIEEWLNNAGINYHDRLAHTWHTRQWILRRRL